MKKHFLLIVIMITSLGSFAQSGYRFDIDTILPHTLVKNQYQSSTCWCFSTLSFIESEVYRTSGQNVDLSERYITRNLYPQKISKYINSNGESTLSGGSLAHDVMNTIALVGIISEVDSERAWSKVKGGNNTKQIKTYLDSALTNNNDQSWLDSTTVLLNQQYGNYGHDEIVNQGILYCDSVLNIDPQDYLEITSFTHHPFYKKFVLEIPDNFSKDSYQNVPLNEFEDIVDHAIDKGYTISWDGDVSEETFMARDGLAILPDMNIKSNKKKVLQNKPTKETEPTQELRQKGFDDHTTEDDHLMHIVGRAFDQNGTKYYIIKNSWGVFGVNNGYIFMSASYFYMKTIAVMVHKDVIPEEIKSKMGLVD